jgi:hypothetical protein
LVVALALATAGCGGEGGTSGVDFAMFLTGMIQNTDDRTDPIEINSFQFTVREDPHQFDSLLVW